MSSDAESFWNLDLEGPIEKTPKRVMQQQAEFLTEDTNGSLVGIVTTRKDPTDPRTMLHEFTVRVPALGGYKFRLFFISHSMTLYPVTIGSELLSGTSYKCTNIEEVEAGIREVLNNESVKRVINSLYIQSQDEE